MDESSFYYYQMSYNVFGSSDFPNDDNSNNPAEKDPIFDPFPEFLFDEWSDHEDEQASSVVSGSTSNTILFQASEVDDSGGNSNVSIQHVGNKSSTDNRWGSQERKEVRDKVAFKTKSDVEILNDGFKWRKYGKKMVKNSPNPRNYYKCSVDGCLVKKRVERDRDDPGYVITTYEGVHNHESPNF